jgi:phage tail-like protein
MSENRRIGTYEVNTAFRFTIRINNEDVAAFTECTLPTLQVETQDIKEGGQNRYIHRLPVRVNAGTLKLKRGLTKRSLLYVWYLKVEDQTIKAARQDIEVVMYDISHKEFASWVFYQAYPIKWTGPTLKTDSQAFAFEEIEVAHAGFEVRWK